MDYLSAFSSCLMGTEKHKMEKRDTDPTELKRTITVNFSRVFKQKPQFIVSISGFDFNKVKDDTDSDTDSDDYRYQLFNINTWVDDYRLTNSTASFHVTCYGSGIKSFQASWIACEKN